MEFFESRPQNGKSCLSDEASLSDKPGEVAAMNETVRALGICVFGAALLCGGSAWAQAVPTGASERFSGSVRGQVIYASNVAGGDETIAALRGVKPADVTYDLGTTFNLRLPSGRESYFLTGSVDVQRHAQNSVLDSENYSILGGASGRIGPCTGSGTASFNRANTQAEDLTIAVTRNITTQEGVTGSVGCGRGAWFASLQGGFTDSSNSATGAGFIGSQTGNVSASVGYQNKTAGNVALSLQYSKSSYNDDPAILLGQPGGFEQYGVSASYSRRLGLRLNGTASVSLQTVKSPGTTLVPASSSTNLGSDVGFNYRVSSRLGLTLAYDLSNQASPTVNAIYVRVETLRAGATYTLNQRTSLHFNASKSRSEYRGGLPIFLQVRTDDNDVIGGGVSLRIGRKVALSLDASHTARRADISAFNYSSNQVTLGLTGTF